MSKQVKKVIGGVAVLVALAAGGAAIAGAATSHNSGTATTTTTTTSSAGASSQAPPAFNGPAHGTAAHENAEKAVTGTAAAKAQAAAVRLVGSGTAGPVTTDLPGTGYETTVTKPDGTKVEVHLDSSFNAFQGHGPGGPPPTGSGGYSA